MFSRLSSILHQAVEVIAPTVPQQNDFVAHWKSITSFFTSTKDHKISIDQTNLPYHITCMFQQLQDEEDSDGPSRTGPCLEYLLQHKILETLSTLARTDTPPGMRQEVLLFFTKLLSRLDHPLLPHVHVHKPVQRLVRLCGDQRAGPTEEEEIHFLCTLCAKFTNTPYLVNFFIETPVENTSANNNASPAHGLKLRTDLPVFPVVHSLLSLMESPDARVAVKSCEGLMLLCTLTESSCTEATIQHTQLCSYLARQLCILCKRLPFALSPVDIEATQAKWGMDVHTVRDDAMNFPGKVPLLAFLSWLDYCDQLISVSTTLVAKAVAKHIREKFLEGLLKSRMLQTSEAGSITAIALLTRCLYCVHSTPLLQEFVTFILGDDNSAEQMATDTTTVRNRLIYKCNHISDEMSLTTLKLFDILLVKPHAFVYNNLVLRNLLTRQYLGQTTNSISDQSPRPEALQSSIEIEQDSANQNNNSCSAENITDVCKVESETVMDNSKSIEGVSSENVPESHESLCKQSENITEKESASKMSDSPECKISESKGVPDETHNELEVNSSASDPHTEQALKGTNSLESQHGETESQSEETIARPGASGTPPSQTDALASEMDVPSTQTNPPASNLDESTLQTDAARSQKDALQSDTPASDNHPDATKLQTHAATFQSIDNKNTTTNAVTDTVEKEEDEIMQLLTELMSENNADDIDSSHNDPSIDGTDDDSISNIPMSENAIKSQISTESDGLFSGAADKVDNGNKSDIHTFVRSILDLVPVEARSSADLGDTGYDIYLRDAHAQFADTCKMCTSFEWPEQLLEYTTLDTEVFFEGEFMKMVLHRLSKVLDQSYEINLQLTSVLSKLALLPHPNLHEYLMQTGQPSKATHNSLVQVLTKVCTEINSRLKANPSLIGQLHSLRKRLAAFNLDIRSVENGKVLAGIIVVEEFCKELAAIAFVKHHQMA